MKATKHQTKIRNSYIDQQGIFKCPECGVEWIGTPIIENPGEEKVQIMCLYGCGYIYLPERREWK